MKILHVSSEIRYELGCAASLSNLGYDVYYLQIGPKIGIDSTEFRDISVFTDQGRSKVKYMELPELFDAILHPRGYVPKPIRDESFDVVITTPTHPFYIANYIAKKHKIPLILRVWGVRPNKLIDNIMYGKKYSELLNLFPSILNNIYMVYSSKEVIALDDSTSSFLKNIVVGRNIYKIYPTYSAIYEKCNKEIPSEISELCESKDYVFTIIVNLKRWNDKLLFKILYMVSKKNPEIKFIIAGTNINEVLKVFYPLPIPSNMHFLGGCEDYELKVLYECAKLVVFPFFFRSVSNRLLESLFYGKPILTNSFAKICHNRLEHLYHVYISDRYDEYPNIVKQIIKDDILLEELSLGARTAYRSFFSSKLHGLFMKKIIRGY